MQVLRLLAARGRACRAVSTITAAAATLSPSVGRDAGEDENEDDEGPFFDLDFSSSARCASGRASSGSSDSDDDDDSASAEELDFIISLQRSRSASPSYESLFFGGAAPLKFCASEPPPTEPRHCSGRKRGVGLRALSFGARKAVFYGAPRHGFARSSASARSLRLFMEDSPVAAAAHDDHQEDHDDAAVDLPRRAPSGAVIRRYLTKISSRFRGRHGAVDARGLRHLRKSRSASAATSAAPSRRDDSLAEKQDGIASAIAHCKESLHRASISSDCDSPLLRSRSDPGKCQTEDQVEEEACRET